MIVRSVDYENLKRVMEVIALSRLLGRWEEDVKKNACVEHILMHQHYLRIRMRGRRLRCTHFGFGLPHGSSGSSDEEMIETCEARFRVLEKVFKEYFGFSCVAEW